MADRLLRYSSLKSASFMSARRGSTQTREMMQRLSTLFFGMIPASTASSTPSAMPAWTGPPYTMTSAIFFSWTLGTMIVAGFTILPPSTRQKKREKPAVCPMMVANAWPTGPSISPITISGSVQSQSWLPSPIASPKRILIRSGMTAPPCGTFECAVLPENGAHPTPGRSAVSSRRPSRETPLAGMIANVMDERRYRLGFAGFGHVGRALARLLLERRDELRRRHALVFDVTLLASARRGTLLEPRGIDLEKALDFGWTSGHRLLDVLERAPVDLLFEATPLEPRTGEPALSHMRAALGAGISVVSANKGPIALAARELAAIAARTGAGLRFESAVADCMPVFNLIEAAVPVGRILRFRGVLNSTSNHVLQAVARDGAAGEAIAEMQKLGLAETDPAHDLDGWDQAVKVVILANVLMGRDL